MAAQFVFILQRVHDRAKLESYWARAGATFAGHSVKLLAGYSPVEVIEGQGPVLATVIAEFPDRDAALAWYHSPAYTEVRRYRLEGADCLAILIDGSRRIPVEERGVG